MVSSSIQLSDQEQAALSMLAHQTGRSADDLVHEAIQQMLLRRDVSSRRALLTQAKGIWSDHPELPDVENLRREFNRNPG